MSASAFDRPRIDAESAAAPSTGATGRWATSGALALSIAVAAGSLHVLFDAQFWWTVVVLVVAAVLAAAAVVRQFSNRRLLPPLAAGAVLLGTLTLLFAPGAAILAILPTPETFSDFGLLFEAASTSIYRQSIPAEADGAVVFVLSVGFGVVAIAADLVAIAGRRPALVGFLLLGILAVPAAIAREVSDPVAFAATAVAFLVLLVAGRPRRSPALAAAIGVAAIVGALVAPVVLPGIATRVSAGAPGFSTGINPVLGLGDDLRRASERDVLDYSTTSGGGHYLRLVSLDDFTGTEWAPTESELDTANTIDAFASAPGLSPDVPTVGETSRIDIGNLSSQWLPLPYPPTRVEGVANDWFWEPEGFSVSSPDDTSRGQNYTVDSLIVQPSPAQLLASGTSLAAGFESYLELPEDLPTAISETANRVAASATSNYERAIALQEFFRSDDFTYSEDAPVDGGYDGTGVEIIATFLDVRSGYCVHFASSMAVMSRALGIPARVVVGFLPGTAGTIDGEPSFTVTTHDLHAWPELYFDGVGWVQFEPTPGRGELGAYADVTVAGVPAPVAAPVTPGAAPTPTPSVAPGGAADRGLDDSGSPTGGQAAGPLLWIAAALAVTALFSLLPALVRRMQRMRLSAALRSGTATAIDAWTEVLRTAVDLRISVSVTATPRETAARLDVGPAATAPLDRLREAAEFEGYAPSRDRIEGSILERDVAAVTAALSQQQAGRRGRVLAWLFPASLWRRIAHPLGSTEWVDRVGAR